MVDNAVKINTYKVSARGAAGRSIQLPTAWVKDLGIKPGDRLDIYRDLSGRLIIEKADHDPS